MKVQRVLEYDCFFCDRCREYVYDESIGDPRQQVQARTRVEDLPPYWRCPICAAPKQLLRACTLVDHFDKYETAVKASGQKPIALITARPCQNQQVS